MMLFKMIRRVEGRGRGSSRGQREMEGVGDGGETGDEKW